MQIAEALDTSEGKRSILRTNTAVAQIRMRTVDPADHGAFVDINAAVTKGIGAIVTLEQMNTVQDVAPIFQIATFDQADSNVTLARGADGKPINVHKHRGKEYVEDERTGALYPVRQAKDADTGATYYEREDSPESEP